MGLDSMEASIMKHMDDEDNPIQQAIEDTPVVTETEPETTELPKEQVDTVQDVVEEPEFELDDGRKVKLSQIKEWEQGNLRQSDYTKKTQELSEKRKELEELEKFANYLKANPNKLQKVVSILEEKEEQAQEQANVIDGLDESDPMFQYMKKQNETLMGEIKALKGNLQQAEMVKRTQEAQNTLNSTLNEATGEFNFSDDNEKNAHRQLVLSHLKDNPKQYNSETDFKQAIKETSKMYFNTLKQIGEARVKAYIQSKKTPVATTEQSTTQGSYEPKSFSIESLQDDIQKMLEQGE